MKSAHDSPFVFDQAMCLALEDDATVEAFSVLAT